MYRTDTNRGIALILVLVVLIVVVIFSVALIGLSTMQSRYSLRRGNEVITRQSAQAGIQEAYLILRDIYDWGKIEAAMTMEEKEDRENKHDDDDGGGHGHRDFSVVPDGGSIPPLLINDSYFPQNGTYFTTTVDATDFFSCAVTSTGYFKRNNSLGDDPSNRLWEKAIKVIFNKNAFKYALNSMISSELYTVPDLKPYYSVMNTEIYDLYAPGVSAYSIAISKSKFYGTLGFGNKDSMLVTRDLDPLNESGNRIRTLSAEATDLQRFETVSIHQDPDLPLDVATKKKRKLRCYDPPLYKRQGELIFDETEHLGDFYLAHGEYEDLIIKNSHKITLREGFYKARNLVLGDLYHPTDITIIPDEHNETPAFIFVEDEITIGQGVNINFDGDPGKIVIIAMKPSCKTFLSECRFCGYIGGASWVLLYKAQIQGAIEGNQLTCFSSDIRYGKTKDKATIVSWEEVRK
ncbi:MAG: hypothetical protein RDV48_07210 [Candidatus Eremiobacteraeota bacterium]|nr:hypothetical protein [Candidatus Eremiobacteraeota bacterium]